MKESFDKITIVNAHWNNRGDEAALRAVLAGLQKKYPNSKITIIFKDGKTVEQFPDSKNVEVFAAKFNAKIFDIWITTLSCGIVGINKLLKKTVRTLRTSDLIIYSPGGSVINKRFWWIKQMEYLTPFICAKLYRIPMRVAAPSVGPFDTNKSNLITKWLLKTPEVFCVREEISRRYLEEIGIHDNVNVTIDSAFYDEVDFEVNNKILENDKELKIFLGKYSKVVGLTITDFKWHVKYSKEKDLAQRIDESFRDFIRMLNSRGYGVLFIPQLFGNQNDIDYMSTFSMENTFILSDKRDTYFQQYIISKLFAVVGMRYHSNIFSAKMGTPFIAVVYEEKMEGFLQLAEYDDYAILLKQLNEERLFSAFDSLEENYDSVKDKLIDERTVWKEKAERTINLITL